MNCNIVNNDFAQLVQLSLKKHNCLLVKWKRYSDQLNQASDITTFNSSHNHKHVITSTGLLIGYDFDFDTFSACIDVTSQWQRTTFFRITLPGMTLSAPLKLIFAFFHCDDKNQERFVFHINDYRVILQLSQYSPPTVDVIDDKNFKCCIQFFCEEIKKLGKLLNYFKLNDTLFRFSIHDECIKMTNCKSNESKILSFPISPISASMFGPFICVWDALNGVYVLDVRTEKVDHWETKVINAGCLYDGHYDRLIIFGQDGIMYDFTTRSAIRAYDYLKDQSFVVCKHCDNHILPLNCYNPHRALVINSAFNLI